MEDAKADRKRKLMVFFMAFIMISSVFGVIFFGFSSGDSATKLKYNNYKFVRKGNLWTANVNGREAIFTYSPADAELIGAKPEITNMLKNRFEIDVTADANDTFIQGIALAQFQMKAALANFNVFVREGFTAGNKFNLSVIRCEDATQFIPVIYFKKGNSTKIYSNESCVIVEASNNADFILAKDRIVYGMLDIIR